MTLPIDLAILHAVSLSSWAALLKAHGARRAPKSLADVRAALEGAKGDLATALRTLRGLARDDARAAVLLAARVFGVDPGADGWPRDVTAAGLAAALLARAPKDPAIAGVLRAAELHLCRRAPIAPKRRYVAAEAKEATVTRAALGAFAAAIERANERRDARGKVDVAIAARDEARIVLDVVRPEPLRSDLGRDRNGALAGVVTKEWTPIAIDRIVFDRTRDGRTVLWIATSAPELLAPYRAAIGEALFGDASLFGAPRPVPLRALQRAGRAVLKRARAGHPRLRDARFVSVIWDPGREETLTIDGRDVLAAMERGELPSQGRLLGVRLRLDFDDGPVNVTLRIPNLVHWEWDGDASHDDAVDAFVEAILADLPEGDRENLVTLAPHDHAAAVWRAALGDAVFAALEARGLFSASSSRALGHPAHAGAGRIMLAFALGKGGRYYVVGEEGFDAEPWLAEERDLLTYRLDVEKLGREIQRELGATGDLPRAIEGGSLVDVGAVTVGTALARLYLVVAGRAREGLADRLRERSAGGQPVLIVPPGVKLGSGCAEAEMASLEAPYAGIIAAVAKALGVTDALGAWTRAPKGTRLAVDRKTGSAWLDGVELVALAEATRVFVRVVVEAAGRPVPGGECDRKLSGARLGAGAAKKAKARFASGAVKSFALVGREPPEDLERMIEGTRMGYRVTVKAWIG